VPARSDRSDAAEARLTVLSGPSGVGKDAVTDEVFDGWWITFTDSRTAIRCDNKPDCEPGDLAICTWEFRRKS